MLDQEYAELIQRHLHELNRSITIEKILANPRYKLVWAYWQALAYFKQDNHYHSLDDAPEGIEWIAIMTNEARENYRWKGKYEFVQRMAKEDCKSIYGK